MDLGSRQNMSGGGAAGTLETDVGPEVYRQLLERFLRNLPGLLADLNSAAQAGDVPAARYVAHQIKGSALSFGALSLDELAWRVLWLGEDQGHLLPTLVDRLEREIDRLQIQSSDSPIAEADDEVGSLEGNVGPLVYRQLRAAFLEHLPRQLAALKNAAEVGDVPGARFVAHQINGSAPSFYATRLDGLADQVLLLGADQGDLLWDLVDQIELEVARLESPSAP
jgi:HPt (histidine-containing phosphotransfer) domain-containing protein